MNKSPNRMDRIGDLIQQQLAVLLQRDSNDPRFSGVTLSHVIVSKDSAHAKIFFTLLEDSPEKIKKTTAALNKAAGFFQYHLKDQVQLRKLPHLHFFYDEALIESNRLAALISHLPRSAETENEDE